MTIILAGITLNKDIKLEPAIESIPKIKTEIMPTRNGPDLKWEKIIKDRPIDLVGGSDYGKVLFSIIQALSVMAETIGWDDTLIYNSTSMPVYFRHSDTPVIEYNPVKFGTVIAATDYVVDVKIKLVWKVA